MFLKRLIHTAIGSISGIGIVGAVITAFVTKWKIFNFPNWAITVYGIIVLSYFLL